MKRWKRFVFGAANGMFLGACLVGNSGCLMQRTVTDSGGEVIYQDTEVHSPFESERKKDAEVEKKERQLGWE